MRCGCHRFSWSPPHSYGSERGGGQPHNRHQNHPLPRSLLCGAEIYKHVRTLMNGQSAGASCPPFVSDPLIPIVVNELCPVVISMSSPWNDPVPPFNVTDDQGKSQYHITQHHTQHNIAPRSTTQHHTAPHSTTHRASSPPHLVCRLSLLLVLGASSS